MKVFVERDDPINGTVRIEVDETEVLPSDRILYHVSDDPPPTPPEEPKGEPGVGMLEELQKTQADMLYQLVMNGVI